MPQISTYNDLYNQIEALLVRLSLFVEAGAGPAEERGGGQGQGEEEEQPGRQVKLLPLKT
jgi:hypothetical protein